MDHNLMQSLTKGSPFHPFQLGLTHPFHYIKHDPDALTTPVSNNNGHCQQPATTTSSGHGLGIPSHHPNQLSPAHHPPTPTMANQGSGGGIMSGSQSGDEGEGMGSLDESIDWNDATVRAAIMELLREMSQVHLASMCPLSQPTISNIANCKGSAKISRDKCREFGAWYLSYRKEHAPCPTKSEPEGRMTFHSTKELPQMRDWYRQNYNPSDAVLMNYVDELNKQSPLRQERSQVTLAKLRNWWKNERQRERKLLGQVVPGKRGRKRKSLPGQPVGDGGSSGSELSPSSQQPLHLAQTQPLTHQQSNSSQQNAFPAPPAAHTNNGHHHPPPLLPATIASPG